MCGERGRGRGVWRELEGEGGWKGMCGEGEVGRGVWRERGRDGVCGER